jgi:cation transport regulator
MAYDTLKELPQPVRHVLPIRAQEIFLESFNSAWENYDHNEERAFRVAWAAVKRAYEKDVKTGLWKPKSHSMSKN